MAEHQSTLWNYWGEGAHRLVPHADQGLGGWSTEKEEEIALFETQERFQVEASERRVAFEVEMRKARAAFVAAEETRRDDNITPLVQKLFHQGVREARRQTVPAYTFEGFRKLPVEIQLRIWSLAAHTEDPRIHSFAPIFKSDYNFAHFNGRNRRIIQGSSRINMRPQSIRSEGSRPCYTLLAICRDSRMVARSIFSYIPFVDYEWNRRGRFANFNTLYDTFYIGGYHWQSFKILVDLLIKMNTTRDLQFGAKEEVKNIQNIRLLIVDLNIYSSLPTHLWLQFPKLELLTIAFYPFPTIHDIEPQEDPESLEFEKPYKRSRFGKRAEWISKTVTESFENIKKDLPQWKVPKIDVVVRLTGVDEDFEVEDALDYDSEDECEQGEDAEEKTEGGKENEEDGNDDDDNEEAEDDLESEVDESAYYEQLEARMTHEVPREEIKRLKRKHHPSKTVGIADWECGRPVGTYFTDSENESGGPEFCGWKTDSDESAYSDSD